MSEPSTDDVKRQLVEAAQKAGYGDPSDGQDYLDRNDVPYDPAEGLLSGTAILGNSEIPGEHERQEAVSDESLQEREGGLSPNDLRGSETSRAAAGDPEAAPGTEPADVAAGQQMADEQAAGQTPGGSRAES